MGKFRTRSLQVIFFYQQTVISFGGNKVTRIMEAGFQVRSNNTATFALTRQSANRLQFVQHAKNRDREFCFYVASANSTN